MEKTGKHKKRFGLVGKNISYSFSRGYFTKKFKVLGLEEHSYENFDLDSIDEITKVFSLENLGGLNVTIPYKEKIIPYLSEVDETAAKIGAVNTIKFTKDGPKGYNTDAYGFKTSLLSSLQDHHKKALILGTGGASKAIAYVLDELDINARFVSRNPKKGQLNYSDITPEIIKSHHLIVNCTPLGTHPNIDDRPELQYNEMTKEHFLFDLIYNPEKTTWRSNGREK